MNTYGLLGCGKACLSSDRFMYAYCNALTVCFRGSPRPRGEVLMSVTIREPHLIQADQLGVGEEGREWGTCANMCVCM